MSFNSDAWQHIVHVGGIGGYIQNSCLVPLLVVERVEGMKNYIYIAARFALEQNETGPFGNFNNVTRGEVGRE